MLTGAQLCLLNLYGALGIWRFCVIGLLLLKVSMDGGIVYQSKEFYGDGECFMEGMASTRAGPTCLQVFAFATLLYISFLCPTLATLSRNAGNRTSFSNPRNKDIHCVFSVLRPFHFYNHASFLSTFPFPSFLPLRYSVLDIYFTTNRPTPVADIKPSFV